MMGMLLICQTEEIATNLAALLLHAANTETQVPAAMVICRQTPKRNGTQHLARLWVRMRPIVASEFVNLQMATISDGIVSGNPYRIVVNLEEIGGEG